MAHFLRGQERLECTGAAVEERRASGSGPYGLHARVQGHHPALRWGSCAEDGCQ